MDDELNGCLEYDLKVFFHEDIRGLYTGKLTRRQVCVWIRHLPGESALVRRGVVETEWSRSEHFAVSTWDTARTSNYYTLAVGGVKDLEAPEPIPHPVWETDRPIDAATEMTRRFLSLKVVSP